MLIYWWPVKAFKGLFWTWELGEQQTHVTKWSAEVLNWRPRRRFLSSSFEREMSLCFSGDRCCEAALCGGEYFKTHTVWYQEKLVFRVLKWPYSRSFRRLRPLDPHQGPALDSLGANSAPKPPAELCPQCQLLSDGPESTKIFEYWRWGEM